MDAEFTAPIVWGVASGSVAFSGSPADTNGFLSANAVRLTILSNTGGNNPDGTAIEYRTALGEVRFGAKQLHDQRGGPFDRKVGQIDIGAYESPADWGTLPEPQMIDTQSYDLVVNSAADVVDADVTGIGQLSLREAILLSNLHAGPQWIAVPDTVGGGQFNLTRGELQISDGVNIVGTGSSRPTLDASASYVAPPSGEGQLGSTLPGSVDAYGNQKFTLPIAEPGSRSVVGSRLIDINDGGASKIDVTLRNLKLTGGFVQGMGGAVRSSENLTIEQSEVIGNSAFQLYESWQDHRFFQFLINDLHLLEGRQDDGYLDYIKWNGRASSFLEMVAPSGGGIYSNGGDLVITDTRIAENIATTSGGGVYAANGGFEITGSEVSGNVVRRSVSGNYIPELTEERGGGITIISASLPRIENSSIRNNIALSAEEAYLNQDGSEAVLPFEFSFGGGIYVRNSRLDIVNSEVSGNEAREGGGIYVVSSTDQSDGRAELYVTNSTISSNEARVRLFVYSAVTDVTARGGGVAAVGDSDVYLSYSTVTANRLVTNSPVKGDFQGGGVYFPDGGSYYSDGSEIRDGNDNLIGGGRLTIDHSVIAGNIGPANFDPAADHQAGFGFNVNVFLASDIYYNDSPRPNLNENTILDISHSLIGENSGLTNVTAGLLTGYRQSRLVNPDNPSQSLEWSKGGVPLPDAKGNLIGGLLLGKVTEYQPGGSVPVTYYYGGYLDPLLDVLADNGGSTQTHAPLTTGPNPLALILPTSVTYVPDDMYNEPGHLAGQIIADAIAGFPLPVYPNVPSSGSAIPLTLPYQYHDLLLRQEIKSATWRTASAGEPGSDYFASTTLVDPKFIFDLGRQASITEFITWAAVDDYYYNPANGLKIASDNEAQDLTLEFFVNDGGVAVSTGTISVKRNRSEAGKSQVFTFDTAFIADEVRVTITDNFFDPTNDMVGYEPGGDRVTLGQVRFVGQLLEPDAQGKYPSVISPLIDAGSTSFNPNNDPDGAAGPLTNLLYDQRGAGYSRVQDGNSVAGARIDIGAYEAGAVPSGQTAVTLQFVNNLTSIPEDVDTTFGVKVADLKVLYGKDLPYIFTIDGEDEDKDMFEVRGRELWIKNNSVLDHETNGVLNVTIAVDDFSSMQSGSGTIAVPAITVSDRNDRPVLADTDLQLTLSRDATPEDNQGMLVSDLLAGANDQDGDVLGVAIVATNAAGYGTVEYTTDGGVIWRNVGEVNAESVLLLQANSNSRLRFNTTSPFTGTLTGAIEFLVWDGTVGEAGKRVAITSLGTSVNSLLPIGTTLVISAAAPAARINVETTVDMAGRLVSVWQEAGGIYGQRIGMAGESVGQPFVVVENDAANPNPTEPDVAALSDGGFIVVWRTTGGIYGRRFNAELELMQQFTATVVNLNGSQTETSEIHLPRIATNSKGKIVVAWQENYYGGNLGEVYLYARQLVILDDGQIVVDWYELNKPD
jgi:hypothetical protein